jgi:hypothetical protein
MAENAGFASACGAASVSSEKRRIRKTESCPNPCDRPTGDCRLTAKLDTMLAPPSGTTYRGTLTEIDKFSQTVDPATRANIYRGTPLPQGKWIRVQPLS